MTALFPPLPYFGALVLTEVWTTLRVDGGDAGLPARDPAGTRRAISCSPACCSAARRSCGPAFVLLPFGLADRACRCSCRPSATARRVGQWAALAVAAAITMVPWFTYNYVYLGRFTLVAGRRHRPRPVGRLVAGPLVRPHPQRSHAHRRGHDRSRRARSRASREVAAARRHRARRHARLRPRVAGHPPHLGEPDRSDGTRARARRRRPGISARRARAHPRGSRRLGRCAARRAAPSSCGRPTFRSATPTSTQTPVLVIRAIWLVQVDPAARSRRRRLVRAARAAGSSPKPRCSRCRCST